MHSKDSKRAGLITRGGLFSGERVRGLGVGLITLFNITPLSIFILSIIYGLGQGGQPCYMVYEQKQTIIRHGFLLEV